MAKLKFIQVNVYKGKYKEDLVAFLREQDADIVALQEVTKGSLSFHREDEDLFAYLKKALGYEGVWHADFHLEEDVGASSGNAVLSKWPIMDSHVVQLKEFRPLKKEEVGDVKLSPFVARHALDVQLEIHGCMLHAISWHGAWVAPPHDTPETIHQASQLADYLASLKEPFVMGCDANAIMQSKMIHLINQVASNCMAGSGVLQSTHPVVHRIVPRGHLVDYVFLSPTLKLLQLEVPPVTVSDHLPVVAQFLMDQGKQLSRLGSSQIASLIR